MNVARAHSWFSCLLLRNGTIIHHIQKILCLINCECSNGAFLNQLFTVTQCDNNTACTKNTFLNQVWMYRSWFSCLLFCNGLTIHLCTKVTIPYSTVNLPRAHSWFSCLLLRNGTSIHNVQKLHSWVNDECSKHTFMYWSAIFILLWQLTVYCYKISKWFFNLTRKG